MNDQVAIERTLAGDPEAFGALVARYQDKVYAVALSRVYDHQDAQDLTQETFVRAYTRLPTLTKPEAFAPWLFTILRHVAVDFLRGRWHMQQRERSVEPMETLAHASEDLRDTVDSRDTARTLWKLVGQLDDKSKEAISLHYGQQLSVSEIAALTGVKESAVKMRLSRARTKLGEQTSRLGSAWGIAPLPLLSSNIVAAVKTAGPLSGSAMAATGGFLGSVVALIALLGWVPRGDVDRWKGKVSDDAQIEAKRRFMLGAVIFVVASVVIPAATGLLRGLGVPGILITIVVSIPLILISVPLLVLAFLREIELLSSRDKIKQVVNLGLLVPFFGAMILAPQVFPVILGLFLALQFFFVNESNMALATITPGFCVTSMLKNRGGALDKPVPVDRPQISDWLTWLHANGLVAPPRKIDGSAVIVRVRLRPGMWEKMTRASHSTLRIETSGIVTCDVVPRDYVALMATFLGEELPPRREVSEALGATFTRGLVAHACGGAESEVIAALGLGECPVNVRNSRVLMVQKYLIPAIGIVIAVASLIYLFMS